ncbi:MAG: CYTH domain-containing protein [Candidatus Moranbacteria bacterium]|nr:CYTH domain-containing protein [Candidatus Moranbacteria bacterium]
MQIEYEATFEKIDKDEMRERLKNTGAKLVRPEFLSRRVTLNLPSGHEIPNAWIRVRDNGQKITQTLKIVANGKIDNQQELEVKVDDFEKTIEFLEKIGCLKKSYQETKREKWELNDVEVTIDEWPFLEPFVEIEGKNENEVRKISEKLGFDWRKALFCAIGHLYERKYRIPENKFNNDFTKIVFEMENPFKNF